MIADISEESRRRELRDELRQRAAEKRAAAMEKLSKPNDLGAVLAALNETLAKLSELLAAQNGADKPTRNFIVTERDENGKVKSFKVES